MVITAALSALAVHSWNTCGGLRMDESIFVNRYHFAKDRTRRCSGPGEFVVSGGGYFVVSVFIPSLLTESLLMASLLMASLDLLMVSLPLTL